MKGNQICSNEGPRPFQGGNNNGVYPTFIIFIALLKSVASSDKRVRSGSSAEYTFMSPNLETECHMTTCESGYGEHYQHALFYLSFDLKKESCSHAVHVSTHPLHDKHWLGYNTVYEMYHV